MRAIIVGDVHGCIDELDELARAVGYRAGLDRMLLLGDLMDRGPDPVGCVRYARENGIESVLGNHEEAHIRWRRHERRRLLDGRPNPMRPLDQKRLAENEALSDADMDWMRSLPVVSEAGGWTAVHAGFEPRVPYADQHPERMVRIRHVDKDGGYLPATEDMSQPPGSVFWSTVYAGARSVVYGHAVHSLTEPRQDEPSPGVFCVGIDTGCVYGGRLTAMVLEPGARPRFVQVRARREYKSPPWTRPMTR